MNRDDIEQRLLRAAALVEEARGLLLAVEAAGAEFDDFRGACRATDRDLNAIDVRLLLGHFDEAVRPKGPTVQLEYVDDLTRNGQRTPCEFVRATKTQIVLREHRVEVRYNARTGEKVGQETSYASRIRGWRNQVARWRIPKDELERIATFGAAK